MKLHRSLIWRVSLIYAVIAIASLSALIFFFREDSPSQNLAGLEEQKEAEARMAATLLVPYLSDTAHPPDPESLHELSKTVSSWVNSRVTIVSHSGEPLADSLWDDSARGREGTSAYDFQSDYDLLRARMGNVASSLRLTFPADHSQVLYTAAPVMSDGEVVGVLRLQTPVPEPGPGIGPELIWFAIWGLASVGVALLLGWLLTRSSSRSLESVRAVTDAFSTAGTGRLRPSPSGRHQ